jgi:hypothetical protein
MIAGSDYRNRHFDECAMVLGNGNSREALDLDAVQDDCQLIGCNAIVRDWPVDYCCGMDQTPIKEWADLAVAGVVYVVNTNRPPVELVCGRSVVKWGPVRPPGESGMFSGLFALLWAVHLGCNPIWVAGFDMDGENIYRGTLGYGRRAAQKRDNQASRFRGLLDNYINNEKCRRPQFKQVGPHTFPYMDKAQIPDEWRLVVNKTTRARAVFRDWGE